jgi:hypothetical protein
MSINKKLPGGFDTICSKPILKAHPDKIKSLSHLNPPTCLWKLEIGN